MPDESDRRAQLVSALGAVRARIAHACEDVGRSSRAVTMIAVTKTCPAADIATLAQLGVLDIGENKEQEARAKIAELAGGKSPTVELRWHMVGQLQSNKARSVASYAAAVHSVDRPRLVRALADAVAASGRAPLEVFVQVSLDGDPQRGGVPVAQLFEVAGVVAGRPELTLRGLMAVPARGDDPDREFARLGELSLQLRERYPGADSISAGMSADLEAAVRHGSTHVRVGTALLGRRNPNFG